MAARTFPRPHKHSCALKHTTDPLRCLIAHISIFPYNSLDIVWFSSFEPLSLLLPQREREREIGRLRACFLDEGYAVQGNWLWREDGSLVWRYHQIVQGVVLRIQNSATTTTTA